MKTTLWISRLALAAGCCAVLASAQAQQSTAPGQPAGLAKFFAGKEDELLEPDAAFKLKLTFQGANTLVAELVPADGYYLYRDKIHFALKEAPGAAIAAVKLPPGEIKVDQFFGRIETYPRPVKGVLTQERAPKAKDFTLVENYQGCHAKLGVCYAPIEKVIKLTFP